MFIPERQYKICRKCGKKIPITVKIGSFTKFTIPVLRSEFPSMSDDFQFQPISISFDIGMEQINKLRDLLFNSCQIPKKYLE